MIPATGGALLQELRRQRRSLPRLRRLDRSGGGADLAELRGRLRLRLLGSSWSGAARVCRKGRGAARWQGDLWRIGCWRGTIRLSGSGHGKRRWRRLLLRVWLKGRSACVLCRLDRIGEI